MGETPYTFKALVTRDQPYLFATYLLILKHFIYVLISKYGECGPNRSAKTDGGCLRIGSYPYMTLKQLNNRQEYGCFSVKQSLYRVACHENTKLSDCDLL